MSLPERDRELLRYALRGRLLFDEPMARHTTLRIGGPTDVWFAPADREDLKRGLEICAELGLAALPAGSGSNLLVRDAGIRGVVVATGSLRGLERIGPSTIQVDAGVATGRLLRSSIRWELGGLEFLGGVPGTVGGGLVMNAGTTLGEFKDVTAEVVSLRVADGTWVQRLGSDCGFRYRASDLGAGEIVVAACLGLWPRKAAEIEAAVSALRSRRREREPIGLPNAGSIFKNPPADFAGRLIEAAGLKGRRVGGAQVSPKHANWIVNLGGAQASDVLALVEIMRAAVVERSGTHLELELKVEGEP